MGADRAILVVSEQEVEPAVVSRILKKLIDDEKPDLENLLLAPYFAEALEKAQAAWRQVVITATLMGLPVTEFSNALSYYDSYRRERLPANLLQAQRDYFGAHTYQRVDKPLDKKFHSEWLDLRRKPKA